MGYQIDSWSSEDGFPLSGMNSVVQSPDGYLWFASNVGDLIRFDGTRFAVFPIEGASPLIGSRITGLLCDSRGRLWISSEGQHLLLYESGIFRRFDQKDGLAPPYHGRTWHFFEDRGGRIWAYRKNDSPKIQLARFRVDRFETVTLDHEFHRNASLGDLMIEPDGSAGWFLQHPSMGSLYQILGEGVREYRLPQTEEGDEEERVISRFFNAKDGTLSFTASSGIYGLVDGTWHKRRNFPVRLRSRFLSTTLQDNHGNYWVLNNSNDLYLSRGDNRLEKVELPEGYDHDRLNRMTEDTDGNIWLVGSHALYRVQPTIFRSWTKDEGIAGARALSVVEDRQNRIWITTRGGVHLLNNDGIPRPHPLSDNENRYWLATPSRQRGVYVVRVREPARLGSWEVERWTNEERQSIAEGPGYVHNILESRKRELWIATNRGLLRCRDGESTLVPLPVDNSSPRVSVSAVAEDREGRLLAAIRTVGIFRLNNERWQRLSPENAPLSTSIWSLHVDEENRVWTGGEDGLALWQEGNWHPFSQASGAPEDAWGITTDAICHLWVMSDEGLLRIKRDLLLRQARGEPVTLQWDRFDRGHGLASQIMGPMHARLWNSNDGKIWIPTLLGVSTVEPAGLSKQTSAISPPIIHIETMLVDGEEAPLAEHNGDNPVLVGQGNHQIDFNYTAINLSGRGQNYYRYRLHGHDSEWIDVGDTRTAVFRRLPPGAYRFEVASGDSPGEWNAVPASVHFEIAPYWWQRWEFRIAMLLAALAGAFFVVRLRRHYLAVRQARQEEFSRQLIALQEDERKRIASELHDGLGQNLVVLKNGIRTVDKAANDDDRQYAMSTIKNVVSQSVAEVRTIARNLHPLQLERLGLTKTIRSTVRQASETSGIRIDASVDEVDGLFPVKDEINIYRIVQEALTNIIKHSEASQANVTIQKRAKNVTIKIKDDGRGFDVEEMLHGEDGHGRAGFGLRGIEERVRIVGGSAEFRSASREGTRLRIDFPLPPEYAE